MRSSGRGRLRKLWRYDKLGPGKVRRSTKELSDRFFGAPPVVVHRYFFICGREIPGDKGSFIKIVAEALVAAGPRRNS